MPVKNSICLPRPQTQQVEQGGGEGGGGEEGGQPGGRHQERCQLSI